MPPKPSTNSVQEVVTLNDITTRIITNAEVLFPQEKDLKVVSGQSSTGMTSYASILASYSKDSTAAKQFKPVLHGSPGSNRRASMIALLDDTEKRIAKQILKK